MSSEKLQASGKAELTMQRRQQNGPQQEGQPPVLTDSSMAQQRLSQPNRLRAADVLTLQRSVGNRTVQRLLLSARHNAASHAASNSGPPLIVQPKLKVGPANDPYEEEADRMAATVMRQIATTPKETDNETGQHDAGQRDAVQRDSVQRDDEEEEENEEDLLQLQRKASAGASLAGGTLDGDTEHSIRAAKGGGSPLGDKVRGKMEGAFGSDFGGVRVHADAHADQVSRSIQARAFTSGRDIFFAKGEYNPGSGGGQKLLAHELTHVVQQTGKVQRRQAKGPKPEKGKAKQGVHHKELANHISRSAAPVTEIRGKVAEGAGVIQRDMGFELQTGWGIRERGPWRLGGRRHRQYNRQEVLRDYGGFQMTADEAQTHLGAEIEFIVKHIPESAGVDYLEAVMDYLEDFAHRMNAFKNRDSFTLDKATGKKADQQIEVFPKIKTHGDMSANPQLTGGIRLDKLTQMFQDLSHSHGAHAQAQSDLVSTGGGGGLGNAAAAVAGMTVNGAAASDKLKGLAAMLVNYLMMGRSDIGHGMTQPTLNYGKASLTLLARTDFRKMFTELPGPEQVYFTAHPKRFRNKVLAAAGNLNKDANVLERGIHGNPVDITRDQWLRGIATNGDLMKEATDARLFGYGEKGNKVDNVGPGAAHTGIIMEFRTMRKNVKYDQWKPMATRIWNYIAALNT